MLYRIDFKSGVYEQTKESLFYSNILTNSNRLYKNHELNISTYSSCVVFCSFNSCFEVNDDITHNPIGFLRWRLFRKQNISTAS